MESKMQLKLFQGTGTSAMSLDRYVEATNMHFFNERPRGQKNPANQASPHEEGEALLAELKKALEAFADATNRPTND
jgi:hypothetical protein